MKLDALKLGSAAITPTIREVRLDDPWAWLAAGWRDLWKHPSISLGYGLIFAAIGLLLSLGLLVLEISSLVLTIAAGFMLLAPMLAVGLYEYSRRLETGEPITFGNIAMVSTRSPAQLAFLGVVLMGVFLIWIRVATLLFALFFGSSPWPPIAEFVPTLLFSWNGLTLLVLGSVIGAGIAFVIFAISAVSVPMLMSEDVDAVTAILTSIQAVLANFGPMFLWAWLIAILTAFGLVTGFVGLIVTFPLIGHATWHAYKALVEIKAT